MNTLLFFQLVKHELAARYRRSLLGLVWMLLLPLISLALYTFVFGVVLQSKWGGDTEDPYLYALAIFIGLTVHSLFAETVDRSAHVFFQNVHLVKKVALPKAQLLFARLAVVFLHNGVIWLLVVLFAIGLKGFDAVLLGLPLVLIPLYIGCLGLGLLLSVLAVYVRDTLQLLPGLILAALFLSPVFYTVDRLPDALRPLAWLNPLTVPIEATRMLLLEHRLYDGTILVVYMGAMILFTAGAYALFRRVEQGVADLL